MKKQIVIVDAKLCSKKYITSIVDKEGPESIVIHGPMACGKTRNAEKLAEKFGFGVVIDNAGEREFGRGLPMNGALIISAYGAELPCYLKSMSFDDAIRA